MVPQPRQIVPVQPKVEEPGGENGDAPGFFQTNAQTVEEVEALLPQLFSHSSGSRDPRYMNWDIVQCLLTPENERILLRVRSCANKSEGSNCFTNKSRLEEIFQGNPICDFNSVGTFSENQNCQYKFFCIQRIQGIVVGVGVGTKKKYAMQAASKSTLWRLGYAELEITTN